MQKRGRSHIGTQYQLYEDDTVKAFLLAIVTTEGALDEARSFCEIVYNIHNADDSQMRTAPLQIHVEDCVNHLNEWLQTLHKLEKRARQQAHKRLERSAAVDSHRRPTGDLSEQPSFPEIWHALLKPRAAVLAPRACIVIQSRFLRQQQSVQNAI